MNGEKKVQITATIDPKIDKWLDKTTGKFGSKSALINEILKQAMLKDTQEAQEGD